MTLLILEDDELLLDIKTSADTERGFRGKVLSKRGGIIADVVCQDPAGDLDRMPCEWVFAGEHTLGQVLRTVMANPTGSAATGWTLHVEEFLDDTGAPYKLTDYSCEGKMLGTVLSDFARITGARWYFESRADGWHWHWSNPGNWPPWKTLHDELDYADEDAANLRVKDQNGEIPVEVDNSRKANRVRYQARSEGLIIPEGLTADGVLTESLDPWRRYGSDVVQSLGTPHSTGGSNSIQFVRTFTAAAGALAPPATVDLGYVALPAYLRDQTSAAFGWWKAYCKAMVTTNQGISASRIPRSVVKIVAVLRSGANIGPALTTGNLAKINPNRNATAKFGTKMSWPVYEKVESTENANGEVMFDLSDVAYIQFVAVLSNPKKITSMTAGKTWTLTVTLDHLWPVAAKAKDTSGPTVSEFYVETAAVTAGSEVPIEARLDDDGMNYADATVLAQAYLEQIQGARKTVGRIAARHVTSRPPSLALAGIHDVPLESLIGLELPTVGVVEEQYPLAEICWRVLDAGDVTELVVGDLPVDMVRAAETIKRQVDRTRAQTT